MLRVKADILRSTFVEMESMLRLYGLSKLCEMYIKKDKLVFHCATVSHFFAYIPFESDNPEEYNFTFELNEEVRLLSEKGDTIISPMGSSISLVNLDTSITLSIKDSKIEDYKPPNLQTEAVGVATLIRGLKHILAYEAVSKLFKIDVPILIMESSFQLRHESLFAVTDTPLPVTTAMSVINARNLLRFLETTTECLFGYDDKVMLFKRTDASMYIPIKDVKLTPHMDMIKGNVPVVNLNYANLPIRIKEIASIKKKVRCTLLVRESSLSLSVKSLSSSLLSNFGDYQLESPVVLTLDLPIEVAAIIFKNLIGEVQINRTATLIVLQSSTDKVIIPAGVFN